MDQPKMAICYDFDKTLSPDDMQTFTLIPSFGMESSEFWKESDTLAHAHRMDNNLAWMYQLLHYAKVHGLSVDREYFHRIGADVMLYPGVETWFERLNRYAAEKGIVLEHYIISSGLKEIIEGSTIARHIQRVYASSYMYGQEGEVLWPAQAINYTNKTQFIFRIAKGCFEEYDQSVNDSVPESQLYIPYENFVYIGDSATDIPCMRLVKSKGGRSIGVFDPVKNNRKKVYQLYGDGRIDLYAPADYTPGSDLERYLQKIIDVTAAREAIKAEQRQLQESADAYKTYALLSNMTDTLEDIKSHIPGNID